MTGPHMSIIAEGRIKSSAIAVWVFARPTLNSTKYMYDALRLFSLAFKEDVCLLH